MNRRTFIKNSLAAAAVMAGSGDYGAASPQAAVKREGTDKMKILVLTGSPRENGNSNALASYFIKGAKEAGHAVTRFDSAQKNVHPCVACNSCGMDGPCIFKDDFEIVRENIIPAGLIAFVTPMYYFGMSAQLKAVIDRFYAISNRLHIPKKAVLMVTYADNSKRKESVISTHYDVLLEYHGWKDAGRIIAPGMWPAGAINNTKYLEQAYALGKNI